MAYNASLISDSSGVQFTYIPPVTGLVIDPTPVEGQDASTDFEEFIIGEGNPVVYITDVRARYPELTPENVHDTPHIKVDLEQVADMISSDTINPWLDVTAEDLSSGKFYDTSVNLR